MLTDSEIKELVNTLLDLKGKLLWMVDQKPINDIQKEYIEKGKAHLKLINQFLEDFHIELPA